MEINSIKSATAVRRLNLLARFCHAVTAVDATTAQFLVDRVRIPRAKVLTGLILDPAQSARLTAAAPGLIAQTYDIRATVAQYRRLYAPTLRIS